MVSEAGQSWNHRCSPKAVMLLAHGVDTARPAGSNVHGLFLIRGSRSQIHPSVTLKSPWIILEELLGTTRAEQHPNRGSWLCSASPKPSQGSRSWQSFAGTLARSSLCPVPGHEGSRAAAAPGGAAPSRMSSGARATPAALIPARLLPELLRVAAIRLSINPVWIVEQSARFVCLVVRGSKVGIVPLQMSTSFFSLRKSWLS